MKDGPSTGVEEGNRKEIPKVDGNIDLEAER